MNSRAFAFASAILSTFALMGCNATVINGGGEGGEGGGEEHPCGVEGDRECPVTECPVSPPEAGASCDIDGLTCDYQTNCGSGTTFTCEPVYPEAGAPSEWVAIGWASEGEDCCAAYPVCAPYETEVASCNGLPPDQVCHAETLCGSTIYCAATACDVTPACDPGDLEIGSECPSDTDCYFVSACGGNYLACVDTALPQHGCPAEEPAEGASCAPSEAICDYAINDDCFSSGMCEDGVWQWVGGGCEGSEGNAG